MYTQKTLLGELLESKTDTLKKIFIYEWLEDINWHSEANEFFTIYFSDYDRREYEVLQNLKLAAVPFSYPESYIESPEVQQTIRKNLAILEEGRKSIGRTIYMTPNGAVADELLRDFIKIDTEMRTFNKMTGWGIDNDGTWESTGVGAAFVVELAKLAELTEARK